MAKGVLLKEKDAFNMSYVLFTSFGGAIVIDGGRREDMPLLKEVVKDAPIKAWILTHPHDDHIDGFVSLYEGNDVPFDIERVIFNFPDYDSLMKVENPPDPDYFHRELNEMLPRFNSIKWRFAEKTTILKQGDCFNIDDLHFECLYSIHEGLYDNLDNDSSLVIKVKGPKKDILFLGDLGPIGGDYLLFENGDKLHSYYCQMAHHGHMGVSFEVYRKIQPTIALWNAPKWLYDEEEKPVYLKDKGYLVLESRLRMHGEKVTREWMELLGVKENHVSYQGNYEFEL